jgi:hypothetical protein
MPASFGLALTYIAVLGFILVSVLALIPSKPRTQVVIKVLFGVLALLVLFQFVVMQ